MMHIYRVISENAIKTGARLSDEQKQWMQALDLMNACDVIVISSEDEIEIATQVVTRKEISPILNRFCSS